MATKYKLSGDVFLELVDGTTTPPTTTPPPTTPPPATEKPPLYSSSVTGTDFEFNMDTDPSAFQSLTYVGFQKFEMPDKRALSPKPALVQDAYVFNCAFNDGTSMLIAESKEFGSKEAAEADALRYTRALGILPLLYRSKIKHMVVHKGGADTTSFAEDRGHFFATYSDNLSKRISTHDLEDTFFHEASHSSIQVDYLNSPAWLAAKAADNAYITEYAKTASAQEDFAESALFAYIIIKHPDRFPAADKAKIEAQIPNRIAFFRSIFL